MGSSLRQPPRLNLCVSARRPRFFNNGKRAEPAAAAESLCVGAPAAFLTMGNPIYRPLRLNFFNNGKPLNQPPRLNLCASARRPRFFNNGKRAAPAAAAESLRVGAPAAFFNNGKPALSRTAALANIFGPVRLRSGFCDTIIAKSAIPVYHIFRLTLCAPPVFTKKS